MLTASTAHRPGSRHGDLRWRLWSALGVLALIAMGGCAPTTTTPTAATTTHVNGFQLTEYALRTPDSSPFAIAVGPDGNLWFVEATGNAVGRVTPGGQVTEYPLASHSATNAALFDIVAGGDGNLWFFEALGNQLGRITPSGSITLFTIPTPAPDAEQGVLGPDGNVWFVERDAGKVGRITPQGTITEYALPTQQSNPTDITVGPDGHSRFVGLSSFQRRSI